MPTYYQMAMKREKEELLYQLRIDYRSFLSEGLHEEFRIDNTDTFRFILDTSIKDLTKMSFSISKKVSHRTFGENIVSPVDRFLRLEEMNVEEDITLAKFVARFRLDMVVCEAQPTLHI